MRRGPVQVSVIIIQCIGIVKGILSHPRLMRNLIQMARPIQRLQLALQKPRKIEINKI